VGYSLPALRLLSILVLLVPLVLGSLAPAAGSASAGGRVNVHEFCTGKFLPGAGVELTTRFTFRNARDGRATAVRVIPGWNVGRLYPKAETALVVRLRPGQIARRVVTRTIPSAPRLSQKLKAGGIKCASTITYDVL